MGTGLALASIEPGAVLPADGSARSLELETVEMNARDIIVIGTSSGGLEALKELVAQLPPDFPATIFVVRHISETVETVLPQILAQSGQLTDREMCLPHTGTVLDLEAEKYRAHLIQMLLLHLNGPLSEASSPTLIETVPAELKEFVAAT